MKTFHESLALLREYNRWRRGEDGVPMPDPREIGEALDVAIRVMAGVDALEYLSRNALATRRVLRDRLQALMYPPAKP
jgi:hypothetical protein